MFDIIQYGEEGFILFTFPMIGFVLERKLSKKQLWWLMTICFVLITPVFLSYHYSIPYVLRLLVLTIFSAAFAIYLKAEEERKYKIRTARITSIVLFFLLGFLALLDNIAGFQKVEKNWYVNDYKIEYISDQGFAGGPLMKYELSRYGFIRLFVKKVDITIDSNSTNNCLINFTDSKMLFNKCNATLSKNEQK